MPSAFFVLAYGAPALGVACQWRVLQAMRQNPAWATRRRCAQLSVGLAATLLCAGLTASDVAFERSIGMAVVAYFLLSDPMGLLALGGLGVLAYPGLRLSLRGPRHGHPVPFPRALGWALSLGMALPMAPFIGGRAAMNWDAARAQ